MNHDKVHDRFFRSGYREGKPFFDYDARKIAYNRYFMNGAKKIEELV